MVMDSKAPSPQSVGREFVRQYYTLLNQAPLHLHRFYSSNSSFVHGGLDAINEGRDGSAGSGGKISTDPVHGQHEIHQRIMQLNFRDCKAKIRQVDAHASLGSGVVVQVSGELSNQGQPMRRFMQTFVLAPQGSKKYYVHNDIFRYQDEVFSDTDGGTSGATTNLRSSDRGQENIDDRGHLLDSTSPNIMAENEKNAAGVPPLTDSPGSAAAAGVVYGTNSINNNNVVMQGVKGNAAVHGQPSNVGVGGDGITTVSINPTMNSPAGGDVEPGAHGIHLTGDSNTPGTPYLNGGPHHGETSMARAGLQQPTSPTTSHQQQQGVAGGSPSVASGVSPSGVGQSRGTTALGAHITPPGAAHGHAAGTGPPPGHPPQGQPLRSPQGPSSKIESAAGDSTAVSPLSSDGQGDGAGSTSGVKRSPANKQPASVADTTEESGDTKSIATGAGTTSESTAAAVVVNEPKTYANLVKSGTSSGPGLQVSPGGLPSAGFNKATPSGSAGNQGHGVAGPFGITGPGSAPPGMQVGGAAGQRGSQSGDMSKEGTPIPSAGGGGQGSYAGTAQGGKGAFSNRSGGRASSGRTSMGGSGMSGGGGRDRFSSTNRDDGPNQDSQERRRTNTTAMYPDSQQLFVGNLPHNCTEGDLESLFSTFGKVAEIRINSKGVAQSKVMPSGQRVPNFGFVVFESDAAVQECLKKTPIHLPDGHRLNVETKKNNKQMRTDGNTGGGSGNSYQGSSSSQGSTGGSQSFGGGAGSGGQGGSKGGRGGQGAAGGNVSGTGVGNTGGSGASGANFDRGSHESLGSRDSTGGAGGRGSWGPRGSRGASRGSRGGGGGGGSGGQGGGGMYSGGGRGSAGSPGGQGSSQGANVGNTSTRGSYGGPGGGGPRRS